MKVLVLCFALATILMSYNLSTDALDCAENACALVDCNPIITKENCIDGEFRVKGSVCNCCDICIPYVGQNRKCEVEQPGADIPATVLCRPPLECIRDRCRRPRPQHDSDDD